MTTSPTIAPTNPSSSSPSTTTAPSTMPAPPKLPALPLTLILATTPSLGIGKNGALPWPQLKKEMGYFARVTKRVPEGQNKINAVVMGRKTWESIPPKFRPLRGRVNVVVTRRPEGLGVGVGVGSAGESVEGPVVVGSVSAALERLRDFANSEHSGGEAGGQAAQRLGIHRVFVIGGASIYQAALELPLVERVLLTKIKREFECDTFFGVDLDREASGWVKRGRRELEEWTGESVAEGGVVEEGIEFEFGMYEREG